jgi:hypothetical protein
MVKNSHFSAVSDHSTIPPSIKAVAEALAPSPHMLAVTRAMEPNLKLMATVDPIGAEIRQFSKLLPDFGAIARPSPPAEKTPPSSAVVSTPRSCFSIGSKGRCATFGKN